MSKHEPLEALARAYDREDASQRGEPDPWKDAEDDAEWVSERLACAQVAESAYLAAARSVPEAGKAVDEEPDAPERIRVARDADGFWTCREAVSGSQEYIRDDLYYAANNRARASEAEATSLRRKLEEANDTPAWEALAKCQKLNVDLRAKLEEAKKALEAADFRRAWSALSGASE